MTIFLFKRSKQLSEEEEDENEDELEEYVLKRDEPELEEDEEDDLETEPEEDNLPLFGVLNLLHTFLLEESH